LPPPPPPHECEFVGVVTREPVCYVAGEKTYTCTDEDCDEFYTEEIDALECVYDDIEDVPANCHDDGYTTVSCSLCGCIKSHDVHEALGCDFVCVIKREPKPGNGGEGLAECTCTRCDCKHTHEIEGLDNNGNGVSNSGKLNYACSTNAENPRVEICWHCVGICPAELDCDYVEVITCR